MNGAVIVETRAMPNLINCIKDHMRFLNGWGLTIFCSDMNFTLLKKNFPDAEIINLKCHLSEDLYNLLLTNISFWNKIKYEKILIFQTDSGILENRIDEFLQYDYVGAPWRFQVHGGNGGLSIRSKDKMISVCEKYPYNYALHGNEDVYFSNHLELVGGNLAPREVCANFSVESIFKLNTFGFHAIKKHLLTEQVEQILKQKQI